MKTKTVLISVNFLVELPSEVLEQESCVLDKLELALSKVPLDVINATTPPGRTLSKDLAQK